MSACQLLFIEQLVLLTVSNSDNTANTRHWPNVVLMLASRLQCQHNIKTTLGQCIIYKLKNTIESSRMLNHQYIQYLYIYKSDDIIK